MRRVAAELGAGTMSLYHYVRSKDELLGLMADRLMGEHAHPGRGAARGWREAMAELARRTRGLFKRHPWIVEHWGRGRPDSPGPSMLRHVEQSLSRSPRP